MTLYIARRLVWTVVVVAVVLAITFVVFYLLPAGDPALRFAGKNPTAAEIAQIRHRLGLDQAVVRPVRQVPQELLHRRQVRLARPRLHVRGGGQTSVKR